MRVNCQLTLTRCNSRSQALRHALRGPDHAAHGAAVNLDGHVLPSDKLMSSFPCTDAANRQPGPFASVSCRNEIFDFVLLKAKHRLRIFDYEYSFSIQEFCDQDRSSTNHRTSHPKSQTTDETS
jgi:hypothetical protein